MKRGEEKGERKNRLLNNEERGDGEVRMVAEIIMKTSKATQTTRARTKMIQMIMVSIMTIIMIIPTINNFYNIKSNGEKSNTHGKNNMFNTHTHTQK